MKWGVLGRDRSVPHLGRKLYHMAAGLTCFALYALVLTREQALLTLATVGGVWIAGDLLRTRWTWLNDLALRYFGPLMRREELKSLSANSYYIVGMILVVAFFPKPIALLAVLYLAVGDPIAAIAGTMYGSRRLVASKSLEGASANFAASALTSYLFALGYLGFPVDRALAFSLLGGAVSAIAELVPLPVNDNLTIPVVSALLLQATALLLPLF